MSILPVYNCSNPILKKKVVPVTVVDSSLRQLISDMFSTLDKIDTGVGLSANQVGSSLSLFILDVSKMDDYMFLSKQKLVFINPCITQYSEDKNVYMEGCLSVPGIYEDLERPDRIRIEYLDEDLILHTYEYSGFLSRAIQHEYDHLHGILFYERLSSFRRALLKGKLKRVLSGTFDVDYDMVK